MHPPFATMRLSHGKRNGTWYLHDDTDVRVSSLAELKPASNTDTPYVLFYERTGGAVAEAPVAQERLSELEALVRADDAAVLDPVPQPQGLDKRLQGWVRGRVLVWRTRCVPTRPC